MKYFISVFSVLFMQMPVDLEAQTPLSFAPFQGIVYDLPGDYLQLGYGDYLNYCDVLYRIKLDSLAIPKTFTHAAYFPGVLVRTRYGIVFTSSVQIPATGCYAFSLESDDGSRLWIGDSLVINNDGSHKMAIEYDTLRLEKGEYPVKVWYYNAFETQFGLMLRAYGLSDSFTCPGEMRKIAFDPQAVLFDHNAFTITPEGTKALDKLCTSLKTIRCSRIHIIGHTDNTGTVEYNKELSLKRAQSIMSYIQAKLANSAIIYRAEGRGATEPVASGSSEIDRQKNRRVEVYVE
jgi:outer membrane protein OmpA-like peptidoglycan-associated protein